MAEHERQKAELAKAVPAPARRWRIGLVEIVAVLALIAAVVGWFR
jgi:hypothetical protein